MSERGILLIASGAYADTELAAEFGPMPPAFLPIGHERLHAIQLRALAGFADTVILSLPESFDVPVWDDHFLRQAGVVVVRVPDGMRLAESILYVLNVIPEAECPVRIMHGDTLIYDLPADAFDMVAIGHANASYAWAAYDARQDCFRSASIDDDAKVLTGYFSFSSAVVLRRALARARGDFISALNGYHAMRPLKAVDTDYWLDFGHLQTYFLSRCDIRTQRAFNSLEIDYRKVSKTSLDSAKMEAEANWFETIPPQMRNYTPGYLGRRAGGGEPGYAIEYLPIPSLHELFAFGRLDVTTWIRIIDSCFGFMNACQAAAGPEDAPDVIGALTTDKTAGRLARYSQQTGLSLTDAWRYEGRNMPGLSRIAENTAACIEPGDARFQGVMHGDFCFTNIFFDHRRQQVRVIDPRGYIEEGQPATIHGDVRYDLAKLNHSISGYYDLILTGRYVCEGIRDRDLSLSFPDNQTALMVEALAAGYAVAGRRTTDRETLATTIHLFLSMLPLHADRPDRQEAFLANALRLYARWEATA